MKKQWLSIVLVLCMVLCMAPTTARAAEGEKTCTLTIKVEVQGLPTSVSAEDATFTFQIKKAINTTTALYNPYDTTTVIVGADGKGTRTVSVAPGKYIVQQTECSQQIGAYIWQKVTYTPSGNNESGEQEMTHDDKSITFTARNTYIPASETNVTTLPITVTGYKAGANVKDARVTTTQPGIDLSYFRFMEKNSDGTWRPALLTETFKENTDYKVEAYFKKIPGCDYTGLTGDSVTVNGVKADAFETTWDDSPKNEDYRVVHGLGQPEVVKTVKSIEITTPPTKTEYKAGEKFDPTGMVVTVHYTDGTKAVLPETGYTIFYGDKLTQGQKDVTIQYNDGSGNSDIKVRQTITVGAYEGPHTHTYAGSRWYSDENSHWRQCTDKDCPDPRASATELASHTFVWKVDQAATTTQTGLKHEECTVCSYKRSENTEIPALRDYAVTVTGGTATVAAGTTITRAMEGVEVTVTADTPETGKVFDKWVVKAGGVILANETSATTTFTMPGNDVKIEATYKDVKIETTYKDAPPSHTHSYGVYVGMTYTAGNFIYQITSIDTATLGQSKVIGVVAAKKNKITKVTIPDRADCKGYGLNVTAVGDKAFVGCKALKKLTIGNKVTVIGKNAFKKCSKLKTVVIGKAVKTISSKAFIGDNKIKKITFKGKKLKTVNKNAFSEKAKKNIKSKKTKLKGNKKAIKLFKKKLKINN